MTETDDKKFVVTTQAHEGIETFFIRLICPALPVTTQAHEGIETFVYVQARQAQYSNNSSP